MKDEIISLPRLKGLHPKVIQPFTDFVNACEAKLNIKLRVTEAMRSIVYQNALYAQGRTTPGNIVTKAKGGSSYHNYGLAIDLAVLENGAMNWNYDMSKLVPFMSAGMEWGGNWKTIIDKPHFQIPFGLTWQQLFAKYNAKDFIAGTNFVNI
jgi:peptidoglycan L-alanyl-D-glutamate endopeptidase CwlK